MTSVLHSKWSRLTEWIQESSVHCLQEMHPLAKFNTTLGLKNKTRYSQQIEVGEVKSMCSYINIQKIRLKSKIKKRQKEYFLLIKGMIYKEDIEHF